MVQAYRGQIIGDDSFNHISNFCGAEAMTFKRLEAFLKSLIRLWWVKLVAVLGLISTAATFLPWVHIPKLLPVEIALVLIIFATFQVYCDVRNTGDALRREKADAENQLSETRGSLLTTRGDLAKSNSDLSEAAKEIGSLQSILAEMRQAERHHTTMNDELRQDVSRLEAEVKRLSWKPYDEHQYTRVRELLGALTYMQRDLLRLVVPLGQCKNEVIFNSRVKMTESFDINGLVKQLCDSGLMTMTHDIHSGSSTYTVNQSFVAPLRDALFPRDEGANHPFFKGI